MRHTKVLLGLLLPALVLTMLLPTGAGSADPQPETFVARVNGVGIPHEHALSRIAGVAAEHGDMFDESTWRPAILNSLINDVIMRQEAERRGLSVTSEDVRDLIAESRAPFPDDGSFRGWLTGQGIDEAELGRRLALQLLASRVYAAVTEDVAVSEEEIEAFYADNQELFTAHDGIRPLVEVRADLERQLSKDARDAAYAAWLVQQREAADVEVLDDDWL